MSGPMSHVQYVSDDGVTYCVRMPTWQAALQTTTACTTQANLPKGYRRRFRYARVTATGREHRLTVVSTGDTLYTDAFGTAVSLPTLGSGTATAATLSGRTGERDKVV
jgi:hypothetical protein